MHIVPIGGGLDSTAVACYLSMHRVKPSHALQLVHVDYGQKNVAQEIEASQRVAKHLNADLHLLKGDLSFSAARIMRGTAQAGDVTQAKSNVLNLRNPFLLTLIASFASTTWPDKELAIYPGFHKEPEGTAFLDALPGYLEPLGQALSAACGQPVRFFTLFEEDDRSNLYKFMKAMYPTVLDMIHSCYEAVPCGQCAHCQQLKSYQSGIV